ncbi:MAG TPA: ribonuclease HI family protein [Patescibacteria group bacterium]|nr:ribonuclease HI family protein [Patescibacteria group bacterium]
MITVYTDGGSRGNPGIAATGIVIKKGLETIEESGAYLGVTTNNTAEYEALIRALTWLTIHKDVALSEESPLLFKLDSQLVVEQLNGRYKIKQPHILVLVKKVHTLISSLGIPAQFLHIPRAENARADMLVNKALDEWQKRA